MDRPAEINHDAVRESLARAVASPVFVGSAQLVRFLTFVVEEALAGRGSQLKEYAIGVGALGRPQHFDPSADSAVRVSARQLRFKLHEYYANEGSSDPVVIELPKGAYVPLFTTREVAVTAPASIAPSAPLATPPLAVPEVLRRSTGLNLSWRTAILLLVVSTLAALTPRLWAARNAARDAAQNVSATEPARLSRTMTAVAERGALPALMVLPFLNLSGAPDEEYVSDGLTEEITAALANVTGLRVIARTSAFRYKGKAQDVRAIGNEVSANVVLEGSVRRSGNTWRITAQLIDVKDGVHLWAATYDQKASDLLTMYDVISRAVTDAIRTRVGGSLAVAQARRGPRDAEAHALYLQGRYFWNQRNPDALKRSIAFYEQAIRRDSTYALAWAGLGDVYATMAANNQALPGVAPPKAMAAARRALLLDPALGEPHATLGLMRAFSDWDWNGADEEFARAIALSPNYATARSWYAITLLARGRFDDALTQLREAQLLDPLSLPIRYNIAEALYFARRWNAAMAQTTHALELEGDHQYVMALRGRILAHMGRIAEARRDFATGFDTLESVVLLGTSNEHDAIKERLRHLPDAIGAMSPFWVGSLYARIGERDLAFKWIDSAYASRHLNLVQIGIDPLLDSLRGDPRYAAMLRKLHLDGGAVMPVGDHAEPRPKR